jgi:hypothetical protein
MEQRAAGEMADVGDRLTGGVIGRLVPCYTDRAEYADWALICRQAGQANHQFGSRAVSYNPPRHMGVGCICDFWTGAS